MLEAHTTQLATKPCVEVDERIFALGVTVIRYPSCGEAVHLRDCLGERDLAVAPRDPPQTVFGPLQALGRMPIVP